MRPVPFLLFGWTRRRFEAFTGVSYVSRDGIAGAIQQFALGAVVHKRGDHVGQVAANLLRHLPYACPHKGKLVARGRGEGFPVAVAHLIDRLGLADVHGGRPSHVVLRYRDGRHQIVERRQLAAPVCGCEQRKVLGMQLKGN